MEFGFTEEQNKFRQEIRDFCQKTPIGEIVGEIDPIGAYSPSFYAKVGEKGWLGLCLPKEYGGQGLDIIYGVIFTEEMGRMLAPLPLLAMCGSEYLWANIILKYGSEDMKKEYLPRIAKGELWFGQMFTEPEAGCDLPSVQTYATRKGDDYIVNGQKQFCTSIHRGEHQFLLARTDRDAPKEKGLSLFLVDPKLPGITLTPTRMTSGWMTSQVFLDDVKIPKRNLVGEENRGWSYFMENLHFYWHRVLGAAVGMMELILDDIIQYTKQVKRDGEFLSQDRLVRQKLAQAAIDIKVIRTLLYHMAWMISKGLDPLHAASLFSAFTEEAQLKFNNTCMEILGLYGQLEAGSKYAPLNGMIEFMYINEAIRFFINEGSATTVRNYIAHYVLGLPECYSYIGAR